MKLVPGRLKQLCNTTIGASILATLILPVLGGLIYGFAWPLPFPADPWGSITIGYLAAFIILGGSLPCYLRARLHVSMIWAAPRFIRGVASSVRSGIPLHEAIERVAKTGIYGVLGKIMSRAIARVKAGMDFDKAMATAAKEAEDPVVDRLTSLLIEAYSAGPKAHDVLDASAEYFTILEEFLLLRDAYTRPYFAIVYLMVGVYLIIVYIVVNVLLAAMTSGELPFQIAIDPQKLAILFYWQSFVSVIAAGLFLGKILYNNARAGFFHAAILILLVTTFFALSVFGPVRLPLGTAPNVTTAVTPTTPA
ncbi:Type II secretion system F protein [Pyrolobus fumarii 1A]|uniref:Type II secretion system F protein n=1 Tax=Pyrolobus fumarii (strain DSM 11204 / 1A) TaxID=694429 RepID=G0EC98_PYRF1|nr:type II secretion system F family protein [Pyrolobus fumarii]AEM39468.1 Type II secretion system F protein [Pyrolobus fumarii 1A]